MAGKNAGGGAGAVFPAWARSVDEVVAHHRTDLATGLSAAEVEARRERFGYNELDKAPPTPIWKLILAQFDDMLVKARIGTRGLHILLLAALISFGLAWVEESPEEAGIRAFIEPLVIVLILVLNAAVGVWQESNAESALEALKEMSAETAKVLRGGALVSDLPARELVPGDVVEIHAGDKVPADVRVVALRTAVVRVEQAALTGESTAVAKAARPCAGGEGCELQAKDNMLFAGTGVVSGTCIGVVNSTGMATEIGEIQAQIQEAAEEEDDTPLKKKLDEFGEALAKIILYVCVGVWLINWRHFMTFKTYGGSWVPDPSTVQFSLAKATFYFKARLRGLARGDGLWEACLPATRKGGGGLPQSLGTRATACCVRRWREQLPHQHGTAPVCWVAVALAVAAIPEGLPAVITTCLALGTRKMAKRNAIVRKLPSVETLGCTTVICSDKTGTLTTNQMSAVTLVALGASPAEVRDFEVEGSTFDPDGGTVLGLTKLDKNLEAIAEVAALCSDARVELKEGHYRAVGQPTEAALLVLAEKLGVPDAAEQQAIIQARKADPAAGAMGACAHYAARFRRLATLEFDRDRKSMSVVVAPAGGGAPPPAAGATPSRRSSRLASIIGGGGGGPAGSNSLLVKGAAECVLARCSRAMLADGSVVPLDAGARRQLGGLLDQLAGRALRLLAFAAKADLGDLADYDGSEGHRGHARLADPSSYETIESDLIFLGVAGLQDPPRPEVRGAIDACTSAGIRVVVITGDNKLTAEAICRRIGVFGERQAIDRRSLTGGAFAALAEHERRALLAQGGGLCFSRAEPRHKQDIVRLLKEMGEVTAMTGDGVNDAPALKLADIGVAMGISGTEVAKEASDMVLADDNFATVVAAVEEGRAIYNNMKAFIRYMISSNIGEVASIFLSAALGLPEGLIPVQLLWVNLVTDGPPATALGFNPPDPDIMAKKPRRASDHFITPWILVRWLVVGMYVGFATVGVFATWYTHSSFLGIDLSGDAHTPVVSFDGPCDYFGAGKAKASTLSLSVLVAIEMFNAANALSEDNSLLQARRVPVWKNPYLLVAMAVSFGLHFAILYVPFLARVFSIVPLSLNEWLLVLAYSLPVVLIDEVLKLIFLSPRCAFWNPCLLRSNGSSGLDWWSLFHKPKAVTPVVVVAAPSPPPTPPVVIVVKQKPTPPTCTGDVLATCCAIDLEPKLAKYGGKLPDVVCVLPKPVKTVVVVEKPTEQKPKVASAKPPTLATAAASSYAAASSGSDGRRLLGGAAASATSAAATTAVVAGGYSSADSQGLGPDVDKYKLIDFPPATWAKEPDFVCVCPVKKKVVVVQAPPPPPPPPSTNVIVVPIPVKPPKSPEVTPPKSPNPWPFPHGDDKGPDSTTDGKPSSAGDGKPAGIPGLGGGLDLGGGLGLGGGVLGGLGGKSNGQGGAATKP
eukprot:scaffold19.g1879.t1